MRFPIPLRALAAAGVAFHALSVFLLGLQLMAPSQVPAYFASIRRLPDRSAELACGQGSFAMQGALSFGAERPVLSIELVGVNDLAQMRQNAETDTSCRPSGDLAECHCAEENFFNPSSWKTA